MCVCVCVCVCAMKEAENALWGEKKTKGWSGVSHFAFAFRSSGQYWGEMVSRVGSTGGRWSVEWAVLGGDCHWSGQYWGEMVSRVGSTGGRWSAEWQYWGEMVSGVGSTGGRWSLERPTGLEKIVHGPALPPLHESSILALYPFVSKA